MLTSLESWNRPDSFHAVLSERSVRWYNACLRITRDADLEDDSARWLMDLAKQSKDVLPALALNRGDRARDALAGIARNDTRDETRKQAVFWLAMLRGNEGADITASVMFNDRNADIREHAAFALAQSEAPRAPADLIRLGNTDSSAEVRGQAWFWLAHMGTLDAEHAIFAALRKNRRGRARARNHRALTLAGRARDPSTDRGGGRSIALARAAQARGVLVVAVRVRRGADVSGAGLDRELVSGPLEVQNQAELAAMIGEFRIDATDA